MKPIAEMIPEYEANLDALSGAPPGSARAAQAGAEFQAAARAD